MTREKAIEILRCVPSSEIGDYSLDEISEALTMAIEVLQKPPISQRSMYQAGYKQGREDALQDMKEGSIDGCNNKK